MSRRKLQLLTCLALLNHHLLVCCIAEACKPPFESIAGFCLYIGADLRLTWHEANEHCAAFNGQLVTCYSIIKVLDAIRSLNRLTTSKPTWTGINDERSERGTARDGWQLGPSSAGVLPANDSLWVAGQPDNFGGNQNCAAIQSTGHLLNDHTCSFQVSLMCEPARGAWQPRHLSPTDPEFLAWNATVQLSGLDLQGCAFKAGAQLNCARFAHRTGGSGGECVLDGCYGNQGNWSTKLLMRQDEWKIFRFEINNL